MYTETRDPKLGGLSFAPFVFAAALAWIAVVVGSKIDWSQYALASALLVLAGTLRLTRVWNSRVGEIPSALIFLAAVGMLRSSAGGISSGAAILALVPVFYTALYSRGPRQLYVVLAGLTALYLAPIVLVGGHDYPDTQYRAALLTVAVSSIIGVVTQRLVASVRHERAQALGRERMMQEVSALVRGLFSSFNARADVCEAAMRIGGATVAILYEPVDSASTLRSTAIVGLEASAIDIPAGETNAVREAFRSGVSRLITEGVEQHVGSHALWRAAGSPSSVLFEPLMRGDDAVGVLVVRWPGEVEAVGPRASVVALLAHEAAAVIDRADMLSELTDMATTDPLTGLPNRRAWDASLAQALSRGRRFTVTMLDLDRFKSYNDTYGHPAGDRLLKETAAIWREQLRTGDVLARLGGEEFGLLLLDCDAAHASDVIERLRELVCHDQTCSAGFAAWRRGESAEALMARADTALYEAKSSGRDRACMSS